MEISCTGDLKKIFDFINAIIKLIKIFIPILLIIMGSLDLGKAVVAGDEKEIKAAQSLLVKRALYAVGVFFVSTVVNMLIGLVEPDWKNCLEAKAASNNSYIVVENDSIR
ncbi:MAG: hypothetical protein PHS45_01915 [Bacilli bacterium]|nr:hypothetical protein [Bacilli bacterium]